MAAVEHDGQMLEPRHREHPVGVRGELDGIADEHERGVVADAEFAESGRHDLGGR